MWGTVWNALVARGGRTVVIGLLALLAAAAVVAVPWYALAATQEVGTAAVSGAPVAERLIAIGWRPSGGEPIPPDPAAHLRKEFSPPGFDSVAGGHTSGEFAPAAAGEAGGGDGQSGGGESGEGESSDGSGPIELNLAYREDVCDHLRLTGECPDGPGEVALPTPVADRLGVELGDELAFSRGDEDADTFTVVGTHQPADPGDSYWGPGTLVGLGSGVLADRPTAFTVPATLPADRVTYTLDLLATPAGFATADVAELAGTVESGVDELRRQAYSVEIAGLETLIDRIARERETVTTQLAIGTAILLLLTWFSLVVVLRQAVVQVRADVGWWRLHGAPSVRGWVVVLGQAVVPLVVGALIGSAVGLLVGRALSGTLEGDAPGTALVQGGVLVSLAVLGGLVAAVAALLGTLRTPVRDLLRQVPGRTGSWRRSLVDLVVVVLAVAAVAQAVATGGDPPGLAQLAPGLAVLAIALITAWAVPTLLVRLAGRALHAGRMALTLIAAAMARRPGTHRLFALVVVAVALVTTGFIGWDTAGRTEWQRAALESGGHRVITVADTDSARLLAVVRSVDPDGDDAMSVVHRPGVGDSPPVLAVDGTRLAAVTGWRTGYGGSVATVANALRPAEPDPILVEAERMDVEAAATTDGPIHLDVRLRALDTGEQVRAVVGPLSDRREGHAADIPACSGGCRLVGIGLLGRAESAGSGGAVSAGTAAGDGGGYEPAPAGAEVRLYSATGISEADRGDPARWRPGLGPRDLGPVVAVEPDALRLTVPDAGDAQLERSDWVFVADTPVPLPVVEAGWKRESSAEWRLAPLAGAAVPVESAGTARLVPLYGETGVLVDLEYAERVVPFALGGDIAQVWLSADAPASIVDDLRAAGLTPLRQQTLAEHTDRLAASGGAVGVRFSAAVAVVGLFLAAGAVGVLAAQQRAGLSGHLAALRAQGIGASTVRRVRYGALLLVIGAATVVGMAAGGVGAALARLLDPGFIDGWSVLSTAPVRLYPVLVAGALALVVIGGAAVAGLAIGRRRTPAGPNGTGER